MDLALSVLYWPSPTRIILVAPGAPGPPRQLTEFGGRVNAGNAVPELAKTGRDLLGLPGDGHQRSKPRRGPSTGLPGPTKFAGPLANTLPYSIWVITWPGVAMCQFALPRARRRPG